MLLFSIELLSLLQSLISVIGNDEELVVGVVVASSTTFNRESLLGTAAEALLRVADVGRVGLIRE